MANLPVCYLPSLHLPLWSLCSGQACQLLLQQQQQQQQQQPSQQQQILQNQRKFMPNVRQQADPQQVHCTLGLFPYSFCEANHKKTLSPSWPGSWLCYSNKGNSRLGFWVAAPNCPPPTTVGLVEEVLSCPGLIPCFTQAWQDLLLICTRKALDRTLVSIIFLDWLKEVLKKTFIQDSDGTKNVRFT